nr:hypothetical protein [uncultured Lachnoclostridium sp.]
MECMNCKRWIRTSKEIKKGDKVSCKCGCVHLCLDKNEYISRWRKL